MMGKQPIEMELGLPNNSYSWRRFELAECLLVSYWCREAPSRGKIFTHTFKDID